MRIIFGLVFISGVYCNVLRAYPLPPNRNVLFNNLGNSVDEVYNSYVAFSDDKDDNRNQLDIFSQIQQIYLNRLHAKMLQKSAAADKYQQTAYLFMKQRDKRYISYLTLCHFKICNMGRKRTTRYFHMIRTLDDKDDE